jgi:hypothetical protein
MTDAALAACARRLAEADAEVARLRRAVRTLREHGLATAASILRNAHHLGPERITCARYLQSRARQRW